MLTLNDYTLAAVTKVLNTEAGDVGGEFSAISTDTRTLKAGELFVALKGDNFDGHDHVAQAMEKGAVAAIVDHRLPLEFPQIVVADTRRALGELARARRLAFRGKVIALTGSNGKTTVKELIAAILRLQGKVLATEGNFNNDIGLPLTFLRLHNDEQFAVIEMGANHPGEIAYLTRIALPDVALITNAGAAHLEGFGSVEGVAKAKAEIFEGLSTNGVAIVNLDDAYADLWLAKTQRFRQIGFGAHSDLASITARDVELRPESTRFSLSIRDDTQRVNLNLSGWHNISNALAAAAAATAVGVEPELIKQGLEGFAGVSGRLKIMRLSNGALLIDDTYNANLDSMKAAIDVLSHYPAPRVLVIGDLFESGERAQEIHKQLGQYAQEQGVDELLAVGELSQYATQAFGDKGRHFAGKDELIEYLKLKLTPQKVVLVKGSRGMRMEEVVTGIAA